MPSVSSLPESMRVLPLILLAMIMVVSIVACTESKITQCNRLNTVVNKVSALRTPGNDPKRWRQLALDMNTIAQEIQSLSLKDPFLVNSQSKLFALITDASRSANTLGESLEKKNITEQNQSIEAIEAILKKEELVINEINEYCGSN